MDVKFRLSCLNREISHNRLAFDRAMDGFFISEQNAGTHWVKRMISLSVAQEYGKPDPAHINNDDSSDIVGEPNVQPKYAEIPWIASTHTIPGIFHGSLMRFDRLNFPPYIVLVRDIRKVLISNYARRRGNYEQNGKCKDFSEYLRCKPLPILKASRVPHNVWTFIHFMNRWGRLQEMHPTKIRIFHYRELRQNPEQNLREMLEHLDLDISSDNINYAIRNSTKPIMQAIETRDRKLNPGLDSKPTIIREDNAENPPEFSQEDLEYLQKILDRNLKYDLGENYTDLARIPALSERPPP